jgi:O-methyltransferase
MFERPVGDSAFVRRMEGYADIYGSGLVVGRSDPEVVLAGAAARIWEMAEYAATIPGMCERLAATFAVEPDVCVRDTTSAVADLTRRGLLHTWPSPDPFRDRYLWLLKRALTNLIYPEDEQRLWLLSGPAGPPAVPPTQEYLRDIRYLDPEGHTSLRRAKESGRLIHRQPGRYSHTMIGLHGLSRIERSAEELFQQGVPGDFVDAGTCRGGAAIFMRALQTAFGESQRRVWVADSFTGVPASTSNVDIAAGLDFSTPRYPWLAASLEMVRDNFRTYELLDDHVRFLPGLFADTLAAAPIEQIALLRLDADLYSSTSDALSALYDRVADDGVVIVDDYGGLEPCRRAVDDFRAARGITAPLQRINWCEVWWRKHD